MGVASGLASGSWVGVSSPLLLFADDVDVDVGLQVRHGRSSFVSTNTSPLAPLKMMPQQISVLKAQQHHQRLVK